MNLLVDTHVFLWQLFGDDRLAERQKSILRNLETKLFLSAVSVFEITLKVKIGKLDLPMPYAKKLLLIYEDFDFHPLSISSSHANMAGLFALDHKDPFDRLLAAQSIVEDMPIMTIDGRIGDFGARAIW